MVHLTSLVALAPLEGVAVAMGAVIALARNHLDPATRMTSLTKLSKRISPT